MAPGWQRHLRWLVEKRDVQTQGNQMKRRMLKLQNY